MPELAEPSELLEAQQGEAFAAAVLRVRSSSWQPVSGQPEGPAALQVATVFWMLSCSRNERSPPKKTVKTLALSLSSQESPSIHSVGAGRAHIHAAFCPCGQGRKRITPALLRRRLPGRRTQRENTTGSQDTRKIRRNPHFTHRQLSNYESEFNSHKEVNLKGCINSLINMFLDIDQGVKFCTETDLTGEPSQSSVVNH